MTLGNSGEVDSMAAVAVYLVRHAHAQPRDGWAGSDRERPLTDRGAKEAQAIVDHFDTGPPGGALSHDLGAVQPEPRPTLLMSSSAERCLATLRPLAAACGLPVGTAEFLAEGSDACSSLVQLKDLAARGGVPVLCTHGDVVWGILELLEKAGVRLTGPLDAKKGSIWVLETVSGSVESARYIPPDKV
jgi:8-oxo-dGTP diphosphatase